ncbi:MAG TPA: hypothetical protein PLS22_00580, partial [Aquabacterium sp.]|nr:hypothetical protein [Aquabacterium sp.]
QGVDVPGGEFHDFSSTLILLMFLSEFCYFLHLATHLATQIISASRGAHLVPTGGCIISSGSADHLDVGSDFPSR